MDGLRLSVQCGESLLDPAFEVLEVEVRRELNRVPEARLVLLDGGGAQARFTLSDSNLLLPGRPVRISLQHEGEPVAVVVFEGLVLRHAVQARAEGTTLRVELKDSAFKLTRHRKSAVHANQDDATLIDTLLRAAKIKLAGSPPSGPVHKELVQHHASDWDFIVSRADVQGLVVDVHRGLFTLAAMDSQAETTRVFDYGSDEVFEFELEIDGAHQWAEMSGTGWDIAGQKLLGPEAAEQPAFTIGDLDASDIARSLGGDSCDLRHPVALEQDALKAWASARLLRSRLALLRGRLVVECDAHFAPLDAIELRHIGGHFNGTVLVSAVTHRLDAEGWKTELALGLPAQWYAQQPDIAEVPAAGLLPPIAGLQIAKVADFDDDPAGESRVRLQWPALDGQNDGSIWARVLQANAGAERGCTFWPQAGDEVVVGFLASDPSQAVILGALHSSAQAPPKFVGAPVKDGAKGAIVSPRGAVIGYEDIDKDKVRLTVSTPGGRTLVLDDGAGQISLSDDLGNQIVMDKDGIKLKTDKDFAIAATGQVAIKGDKVDIQ